MKYKIKKPDFREAKNYSKIPNAIFSDAVLSIYQKHILMYLMTHKNGFHLTTEFIQKGLRLSNWTTVNKHMEVLKEKNYISIKDDGEISFNLNIITNNQISTNSNTTKQISTKPDLDTTKTVTTDTTNSVSTNYSLNEDKTTNSVTTNNKKQEEVEQEIQQERNNNFSSTFSDNSEFKLKMKSYYSDFLKKNSSKHSKINLNLYEGIFVYLLVTNKRNEEIFLENNSQLCEIILNDDLSYLNYSIYDYYIATENHPHINGEIDALVKKLGK